MALVSRPAMNIYISGIRVKRVTAIVPRALVKRVIITWAAVIITQVIAVVWLE